MASKYLFYWAIEVPSGEELATHFGSVTSEFGTKKWRHLLMV